MEIFVQVDLAVGPEEAEPEPIAACVVCA